MPERVIVVTDSTSDIPRQLALAEGLDVVPLAVTIDGGTFEDGSITQEEFFRRMSASPKLPTTSQPSVGAFVEAYERALRAADAVVSIHISSHLSGTTQSARQAAERFGDRVHVFDSLNLSWGLGFQALAAARAAARGLSPQAVVEAAERARGRVDMLVGLDSLENLAKGGRIGRVASFVGSMLDLKVTLTVEDGRLEPVKRMRGQKAAFAHTLEWVGDRMGGARRGAFAVLHALSEDRAARIAEALRAAYDVAELHIVPVGSTIATHTGTGWGVAFLPAEGSGSPRDPRTGL